MDLTDKCSKLHEIYNLIDANVVAPPNLTDHPFMNHVNFIENGPITVDPTSYIIPFHLPKPFMAMGEVSLIVMEKEDIGDICHLEWFDLILRKTHFTHLKSIC